jgi:hypothetical protein
MIKLLDLLKEQPENGSKAIVMAGSAGAGKSSIVKQLQPDLQKAGWEELNADKYVEDKDSPMYNSLGKASSYIEKVDLPNAIKSGRSFLYDTTGTNVDRVKSIESAGYDVMMIMVYAHPIVSFLRNFKRERRVPRMGVISTWNSVYGNIDTYKSKLGDNFVMYQAPDDEYQTEINEFNEAVKQGRLYDWLEELTSKDPDQFKSTLGNKAPEPTTPEEQAKKDKAKEKSTEIYKQQVEQLEREFTNINDKIKNSVLSEQDIVLKVKNFAQ